MSDIEDRKAFSDFLYEVIHDFERMIPSESDRNLILKQIYFGSHFNYNSERGYIEFECNPHRQIRIESYISEDVLYSDPHGPRFTYDLNQLYHDILSSTSFDPDLLDEICEYVQIDFFTKKFEVSIFDSITSTEHRYSHLFSLQDEKNQFHDLLFKEMVISASQLVIPYSNLLEFIKDTIISFDNLSLSRSNRFLEIIETNVSIEFEPNEDLYITQIDIIIDIFRDNHWDGPHLERRIEANLTIQQDQNRFPIQLIWDETSSRGRYQHILKRDLYDWLGHDIKKHMLSYRQINEFIEERFIHN